MTDPKTIERQIEDSIETDIDAAKKYKCGLCLGEGPHCYGNSNNAECECDCQYKCWACKDVIEDEDNEAQDDNGYRYHDSCVPNL